MNYVEGAYTKINPDSRPSSPESTQYQYQRALALSKSVYGFSTEQVKQFQEHSALVYVFVFFRAISDFLSLSQEKGIRDFTKYQRSRINVHHLR